jgi:hypothetical protein
MPATLVSSSTSTMCSARTKIDQLADEIKLYDEKLSSNSFHRPTTTTTSSSHHSSIDDQRIHRGERSSYSLRSKKAKRSENQVRIETENKNSDSVEDVNDASLTNLLLVEGTSRKGRRLVYDNGPKSSQRNERRAIANKLRNKNLLGGSSHHSTTTNNLHGSSHHNSYSTTHGSSQNSSSNFSFCDGAEDDGYMSSSSYVDNNNNHGNNNGKRRTNVTKDAFKNGSKESVKAMQFTAAISSALSCDSDIDTQSVCDNFSSFGLGVAEMNSSIQNLMDDDDSEDDPIDANASLHFSSSSMNVKDSSMWTDFKDKSSLFVKACMKDTRSKRNDSVSSLDSRLLELKDRDLKKKGKNSSIHNMDDDTLNATAGHHSLTEIGKGKDNTTRKKGKSTSLHRDDNIKKTKEKNCIRFTPTTASSNINKKQSTSKKKQQQSMKSCLKTSKRYFERKGTTKFVRYDSSSGSYEKVHMVKSLFKYAKDLWWNHEEINQIMLNNQANFSKNNSDENQMAAIKSYMEAYCQGRYQMNYKHHLASETRRELIRGYRYGFCGIEAHSNLHDSIIQHVKDTNRSIIQSYQNAVLSEQDRIAQGKRSKMDSSVIVKAHSEALTETDRKWATAVGKAIQDAEQND